MDLREIGFQSDYQVPAQSLYTAPKLNDLFVFPLLHGDDAIKPEVMVSIWNQMASENKIKNLFYDGAVKNIHDWLDYIYDKRNYVCLVLDNLGKIYHIAWINKFDKGKGFLHHCSLGNYNRRTWPVLKEYYKTLKYNNSNVINTLMGLTPETNIKAVRLVKMLGWTILGVIPAACYLVYENRHVGGVVSYVVINEV